MVADVDASVGGMGGSCAVISAQRAETRLALLDDEWRCPRYFIFQFYTSFNAKLGRSVIGLS